MQKGSSGTYSQVGFHVVADKLGTPFRYELSHSLLQSLQAKEVNLANGRLTNYKIYLPVIQLIKSDYIIMDNAKVTNIKTI